MYSKKSIFFGFQENRYLLYFYYFTLLVMFFMVAVGATIAAVQNVDELKEPLVKSMTKYDPNSSNSSNLDITRAWDDVQREVSINIILYTV